ncbi:hypothetical protein N7466_010549 [Penicillium verhagenii]|uniref:uncharacterized protein n=1 Tax=Penicillium verhagenii TaxID=1562060 RepID=UPI0025456314|nr:uncharacterized protein N7466_010549 [Penicillium verhagenii]KAJ5918557.1 hypothetical protein N7466_010549 [Penicillium verhagenii]
MFRSGQRKVDAYFRAQKISVGKAPSIHSTQFREFTLTPDSPYATLDYGADVAGFPTFEVDRLSKPAQIEVKYSEQFTGLLQPLSDGPSLFVSSLSNSFRVETFNVTQSGEFDSGLIQGGQRWQSIRLLTNSSVTFRAVSFKSTVGTVDTESLPGSFHSSSPFYNEIWGLGARAVSLACFDAGSQKSIWSVSGEGVLVSSSVPSYSLKSYDFEEYDLHFDAKIARGGVLWSTGYNFGIRSKGGVLINLASNYPADSTFVNVNKTLFPPSTITLAYGVNFVNQTTLTSYPLDSFSVPFDVLEDTWYHITTTVRSGYLAVSLNRTQVFNISLDSYYFGGGSIDSAGAFGFGAWQDQSAHIRNVTALDTNRQLIYQNSMTNATAVLPEYGVHSNYFSECVDGAKRDRLVWQGDFLHTSRIIGVTTYRGDHVTGTLSQLLAYQLSTGQLPTAPSLGYSPTTNGSIFAVANAAYLLPDYHILALMSFVSYMEYSDDVQYAQKHWEAWKLAVNWLVSYRSNSTGLIDFSLFGTAFLGPTSGSAINTAAVGAIEGMALVAEAVGDVSSYNKWKAVAISLKKVVNTAFWSDEYGIYSIATSDPGNYSVAGLGFAITSGSANHTQAQLALSHVPSLKLGPGYRDSSKILSSDSSANLSPNTNGFLLQAILEQKKADLATFLFQNLWGAMIANTSSHSGASWEYVNQQLKPGLGQFTSLSHPWGGAATYTLTNYVAGIRPASFGYKTWVVEPAYVGFGLDEVNATVPTPHGPLRVAWSVKDYLVSVTIDSPAGTIGKLVLSKDWACGQEIMPENCEKATDFIREIQGGKTETFVHRMVI